MKYRIEKDSLGEVKVPCDSLFGAQTMRAVENFSISGQPMPRGFIRALGLIKASAAKANSQLGLLEPEVASSITYHSLAIASGNYDDEFPVDVFQTGSGTSSNMNINEVIATLANRELSVTVHPNDHVNLGQSSNDVIPSAIHISAVLAINESLLPALQNLQQVIEQKADAHRAVIKTGRTHLMDAMPLTLGQELSAWVEQLAQSQESIRESLPRLLQLAQGGTAVGTGVNAAPQFAATFAVQLSQLTGLAFRPADNFFNALSFQGASVELSGKLKNLAVAVMKIANDLRWMNSGPLAGLGEIQLAALQPGSSIMPGKVNPVIPEAAAMAAAQVMGNDVTVGIAGQSGNFQLNVMLPVIAYNLLQSIELMSNSCNALADKAIAGFEVCSEKIDASVQRNPILVTALNSIIGYEKAATIAKQAYVQNRPVIDVAAELTQLARGELEKLLDPKSLVYPNKNGQSHE